MMISKDIYMRISDLTGIDYEGLVLNDEVFYVDSKVVESMFQDMFCEIDSLEEKIEDMEDNIRENYRPITSNKTTAKRTLYIEYTK